MLTLGLQLPYHTVSRRDFLLMFFQAAATGLCFSANQLMEVCACCAECTLLSEASLTQESHWPNVSINLAQA